MSDLVCALRRHQNALRWCLVVAGVVIGLVMVARAQVGGDQISLLARGWLLAARGEWVQFGMKTSAGGLAPGGVTSLIVGVPLMVWRDYRAPGLFLWLVYLGGFLLLDRTVGRSLSGYGRLLLTVLYWLSPWRLFFTAHLWNPSTMFLFGSLHVVTAWQSRERASFWASLVHVVAIGLALQLHASAPVLVLASLLLLARRRVRVSWSGALVGAALVAASLLPWAIAMLDQPPSLPEGKGFLGRGLLYLFPLLRGVLFLLRFGSLLAGGRQLRLDFTPTLGADVDAVLTPVVLSLIWLVTPLTLLLPAFTAGRLWRTRRRLLGRQAAGAVLGNRQWLTDYAVTCLVAAIASFALSPTTIMFWQGFVVFHAVALLEVLLGEALLRSRWAERAARVLVAWSVVAVLLGSVMAVASPMYRRGGRRPVTIELTADYPMLRDLGIPEHCTTPVVGEKGWAPDLFRPDWAGSPKATPENE